MRGIRDIVRKETWSKNKKLKNMKAGDLIYVQRIINGMMYTYECEFIDVEKGLVKVKILALEPDWAWVSDDALIMRVKQKSCYLWGKDKDERMPWAHCHWLKDGVFQ